jgi:hypothetical protein
LLRFCPFTKTQDSFRIKISRHIPFARIIVQRGFLYTAKRVVTPTGLVSLQVWTAYHNLLHHREIADMESGQFLLKLSVISGNTLALLFKASVPNIGVLGTPMFDRGRRKGL